MHLGIVSSLAAKHYLGTMDRLTTLLPAWASPTTAAIFVLTTGTVLTLIGGTKNLPLGYTLRLVPSLYRLLRPRYSSVKPIKSSTQDTLSESQATDKENGTFFADKRLFTHHVTTTRAYLPEIDINVHKSNSTFFIDADISRAELLTSLLSTGLANLPSGLSTNGKGPVKKAGMFLLAGVSCKFLRPIAPLEGYEVSSRILAWEEGQKGALFVVTYFLRIGVSKKLATEAGREVELHGGPAALMKDDKLRRGVFAVLVSRYVFKAGRDGVEPEVVLRAAGLIQDGAGNSAPGKGELDGVFIDGEVVKKAVENGMQYVAGCML